jgi:hypothetical protein
MDQASWEDLTTWRVAVGTVYLVSLFLSGFTALTGLLPPLRWRPIPFYLLLWASILLYSLFSTLLCSPGTGKECWVGTQPPDFVISAVYSYVLCSHPVVHRNSLTAADVFRGRLLCSTITSKLKCSGPAGLIFYCQFKGNNYLLL